MLPKDPLVLQSKAATPILSVVMTPPSLDHCFVDELAQPLSNPHAGNAHSANHTELTKSLELNDYSSIVGNKNRKNFSSLLINDLKTEDHTCDMDVDSKTLTATSLAPAATTMTASKYEKVEVALARNVKKLEVKQKTCADLSYKSHQPLVKTTLKADGSDKDALKHEFKQLVKSINSNLSRIDMFRRKPVHTRLVNDQQTTTGGQSQSTHQTYIHYSAQGPKEDPTAGGQMRQSMSMNYIQQQQQQPPQQKQQQKICQLY